MSKVTVGKPAPRAMLRALKQPLYDTMECPADANAVPNLTFFQTPLGNALPVSGNAKTVADTNLSQSGQIGVPQQFSLAGFCTTFKEDDGYFDVTAAPTAVANFLDDYAEFYEQGLFTFNFGQNRPWLQVPLTRIPHGPFHITGPVDSASDNAAAAGATYFFVHQGDSSKCEYFSFTANDKMIPINSAENFNVQLAWPNANMGLSADGTQSRVTVFLIGILYTAL